MFNRNPVHTRLKLSRVLASIAALVIYLSFGLVPASLAHKESPSHSPTGKPTGIWPVTQSSCATRQSGLISWWAGDGNALDLIGGNDGTFHSAGTTGFLSAKVGQGFRFNGSDSYISIGNPSFLKRTQAITLEAWVAPTELAEGQEATIISKWGQTTTLDAYTIFLRKQGGEIRLVGAIGVAGVSDQGFIGGALPANTFSHVAMTYDAATGQNLLYVNGQQVAARTWEGGIFPSDANVLIGREDSSRLRPFSGVIDEVSIYIDPLSNSEIQAIFTAGSSGKCKPDCSRVSISTQPQNQTIGSGQRATLTVDVSETNVVNRAFYFIQWFQGVSGDLSRPLTDSHGGLTFTTPSLTQTTSYWARVSFNQSCPVYSGTATITVNSTPQQRPLIFIPGIAGSVLNKERVGPNNNVWPYPTGSGISFNDLTLDPAYSPPSIIATDAIRSIPAPVFGVTAPGAIKVYGPLLDMLKTRAGYKEYDVNGDTTRRTTAGCDMSQLQDRPTLFVFAYDWRLSATTNAQMLRDYVGCVQRFYPNTQVDILTHSMGSLIARRYILDNSDAHTINKMVTIAAPWLGAPKGINALETGLFFDGVLDRINSGLLKRLVEFYPGAHQLIPSRSYYDVGGLNRLPYTEYHWDANGNGRVDGTYTDYTQLVSMLDHRYSNPASRPGTRGKIFHDNPGQDNWNQNEGGLDPDPVIRYFHIYGRQPAPLTIGNVYTRIRTKCNVLGFNCRPALGFDVRKTYGDGTVPEFSASRIGNGHNLNAMTAQIVQANTSDDHTGLTRNSGVHNYILSVLRPAQSSAPSVFRQVDRPAGNGVVYLSTVENEQAYYLNISGTASVVVADDFGNSNESVDGSFFGGNMPGATTGMLDAETFFVAMSASNSYTVTFRTGVESLDIELTKGTDTETVQAVRYLDTTLPGNVTATLRITPQGVDNLRYDGNNDGTFETTVTPTISVSGTAAQDTEPPTVVVSEAKQATGTVVTIGASDSTSGVRTIYYSLDGVAYQAYAGPFTVDPYRNPIIYAFADDNVANRSSLVAYQLTAPTRTVQFSTAAYNVKEDAGRATFTVTRSGDPSEAVMVDYRTVDADTFTVGCFDTVNNQGGAYARCDFGTSVGTLRFSAGETSKDVTIPIIDDGYAEGAETFQLHLSNVSGAALGSITVSTVTIEDNDAAGAQNPVLTHPFFVRQQYLDFLSREPDQNGFNAWLGLLNGCPDAFNGPGMPSGCDRIFVSGEGFFRSLEFQLKGFYVFRFYKVAFNRLPEYLEVVSDMSFVAGQTPEEVFARKTQIATLFTERQEFKTLYGGLTNSQYVSTLLGRYNLQQILTPDPAHPDGTAKVTLTSADLVARLDAGTLTRAQILRAIADSETVGGAEFNNAFVGMQYYGYLRRKPDAAGFQAWLRVLQSGDVRTMVNGFLNSTEYKLRFGQP